MPWVLAQRDVAILSAAAALWWVVANGSIGDAGVLSVIVGVLAGIFLGLTWGYAAHEWGHFLGARLARSHIQVSEHRTAIQLFRFDPRDNTRVQFLCMAWGGLIVLWAQAGLFTWLLPWRGASGSASELWPAPSSVPVAAAFWGIGIAGRDETAVFKSYRPTCV